METVTLKERVDTLDDVPAHLRAFYEKADGRWCINRDRMGMWLPVSPPPPPRAPLPPVPPKLSKAEKLELELARRKALIERYAATIAKHQAWLDAAKRETLKPVRQNAERDEQIFRRREAGEMLRTI